MFYRGSNSVKISRRGSSSGA